MIARSRLRVSCGCRSFGSSFHVTEQSDIQRDLQMFAEDLHQLEVEYGLFFAGRVSRPPMETRARVEAIIARWGRVHVSSSADRFRFNTLQSRFFTYTSLWDRALKAREEGRPGPLQHEVRVEGESVSTERGFDVEPAEPAGSRVVVHDLVHQPASGAGQVREPLREGDGFAPCGGAVPSCRSTSSLTSCGIGSMSFRRPAAPRSCARLRSRMGG